MCGIKQWHYSAFGNSEVIPVFVLLPRTNLLPISGNVRDGIQDCGDVNVVGLPEFPALALNLARVTNQNLKQHPWVLRFLRVSFQTSQCQNPAF